MDSTKFSYQRLRKLPTNIGEEEEEEEEEREEKVVVVRRSWLRLRRRRWRRPRLRVLGLRRLLRRKARVVRGAVRKVVKRLKGGKPYIGDLFAGNYMFMQVSPSDPTTMNCLDKSFLPASGPPAPTSCNYSTCIL